MPYVPFNASAAGLGVDVLGAFLGFRFPDVWVHSALVGSF
jgi:hypothetical protein